MPKLCVIAPGSADGGANLLLGRSALHLARNHGWDLHLVDVDGGAVWRLWKRSGVAFTFQAYKAGTVLSIEPTDYLLVCLLGSKLLGKNWIVQPQVRLLLWCTAPQDSFKFLPWSIIAKRWSWNARSVLASCLSWGQKRRIANFLQDASKRGGLIFMDEHTHEVSTVIFGQGIVKRIIPICTDQPALAPRVSYTGSRRAYWIGRVADFKTESLIAAARTLLGSGSGRLADEVVVIGDGDGMARAKAALKGLPVRWLGSLKAVEIDAEIYAYAWFVFGHGTSLLEAAKLGIPSLLIDATYETVSPEMVRMEWVYRGDSGYVGAIVSADQLTGRAPSECIAELESAPNAPGAASHARWLQEHSPYIAATRLLETLSLSDYTVSDFLDSGATRPGLAGRMTEWVKRVVFRKIN